MTKSELLLRTVVQVRELRAANELTKSICPEAEIGDAWEEVLFNILEILDVPVGYQNFFRELTEP